MVVTAPPDEFYTRLTGLAASEEFGSIDEVASPDDNLQAVFTYLVKGRNEELGTGNEELRA